jgi:hypothetical protein
MSQLNTIQVKDLPIYFRRLSVNRGQWFLQIGDALQERGGWTAEPDDRLPPQRQLAA